MKNILFAFTLVLFISCTKAKDYSAENEQEILTYLADNNLTAQKSSSGLYYIVNNSGSGAQATKTDNVTVAYKGYFTNKTVFDESASSGISFN